MYLKAYQEVQLLVIERKSLSACDGLLQESHRDENRHIIAFFLVTTYDIDEKNS